jgi:hypothetical protein
MWQIRAVNLETQMDEIFTKRDNHAQSAEDGQLTAKTGYQKDKRINLASLQKTKTL